MRASKLRLPESTAAQIRSLSMTARLLFRCDVAGIADARGAAIGGDAESELFERLKQPRLVQVFGDHTRGTIARDVLTWRGTFNPAATAFLASRPAASMTLGFDVFVHEVMAAMRMSPLRRPVLADVANSRLSLSAGWLNPLSAIGFE